MRTKTVSMAFLIILLSAFTLYSGSADALFSKNNESKVVVYFFWGNGCPHCAKEKPFLEKLEGKYPQLKVYYLEVWYNSTNAELFQKMAEAYGTKAMGVPTTFIGTFPPIVGYADDSTTGAKIESMIKYCIENGCPDPKEVLNKYLAEGVVAGEQNHVMSSSGEYSPINKTQLQQEISKIPLLNRLNAETSSLVIITLVIGLLDGFNPCAFFVLFFLLSMLVYANSRKKMLLMGGVFVFFSGLVYFLFMAAWLNFFLIAGNIDWITTLAGIIAVIMASINIKDFFAFKRGVSLVIPERAKPKLFARMRALLKKESTVAVVAGTVVLAVAANTYELLCTAGFPMVFTRILTLRQLPVLTYYLYLVLYNVVYVLPLMAIVLAFTFTMGARKFTEWQGRVLKLISGTMMLSLGIVLLKNPALMSSLKTSVGILFGAVLTAIATALLTSKLGIIKKDSESDKMEKQ